MVNEQEEIKLGYLLDPCFELSNTAGKPLTNGWIEVYIHGTRNKYYCYSDFGGTLHPFKIPLDSLGSNIVLADPERAYDVYVYNHFGSLVMSRYNVSPGHAGGAAISSGGNAEHWIGRYGATIPVAANEYSDNIPLPIEPDYEGTFIDHISDNKNIVLKDGLYLVDCLLSFRQNPDSLNNTLGYVHVFTGLDDGESGVFQRNETLPDTDPDETHNIRVQFVRHVDGSTGCNVCFQVRTTNAWSFVRIQGLSIVKLGAGGGIAPQPIEYDAGQYISIDGDVISVTGVQPAGNYADASSVSQGFYDVNQQLNALSGQINEVSGQIPSLDGYATEDWVNDQGFLKEVPSEFVTESELNSAISGKADKSEIPSLEGYATEEWVRQQNYLTEVPSQYVTESELNSAISGKADKSEIPSLDGYATETYVQSAVSGKQDELEFTYDEDNKITTIDGHGIAGTGGGGGSGAVYTPGQYISIQNDVISVTGLQPSGDYQPAGDYLTQDDLNGYATTEDVEAAVSGKADKSEIPSLQGYATEQWVGEQNFATVDDVEEATSGKLDASAYQAPVNADWSATSGLGEILNKPSTEEVQFEELDLSSYVQQNDLSGYVQQSDLSGYVEQSDLSGYVQQSEMSGYASKNDLSGKLDTSAYVAPQNADWNSTSGLSQILNKPTTEEVQFEDLDLSSYVQQSDLSGYATIDDVDEATSGKADLSAIANLSAGVGISITASGDGYVISSEGGGGSVPEGVMAESGLNYTQNGEVSGYNNSAFYDTGINNFVNQNSGAWGGEALPVSGGPGVRMRMDNGILIAEADETLLFSASPTSFTSAFTTSEPISNFEKIAVHTSIFTDNEYLVVNHYYDTYGLLTTNKLNVGFSYEIDNGWKCWGAAKWHISDDQNFVIHNAGRWFAGPGSTSFGGNDLIEFSNSCIYKVIGINRIAGGN